jgi:peptide/nickel transport system permease protein
MAIGVFVARRLAGVVVVLAGVSFLIFALLEISPGSVVAALLGGRPASPQVVQAITAKYQLNEPLPVQYWHWLGRVGSGDLGRSVQSGQTVTSMIAGRLPLTLELAGLALVVVLLLGVPAGFAAGVRRGGWLDRGVSAGSVLGLSAPAFAVGIVLIYLFGVRLAWLPVYGAGAGFGDRLSHLVLPVVTLAAGLLALVVRQTRAAVLDVMAQDYITFAYARGLPRWRVLVPYALRNSSLPIITAAGLLAIYAISGTVLVETVFSVPGLGSLLVSSIQDKDILVAQGVALVIALAVVGINVIVDLVMLVVDPRTRHPAGA